MRLTRLGKIALVSSLMAVGPVTAATAQDRNVTPSQPTQGEFGDQKIQAFAVAFVQVRDIRQQAHADINAATTEEEQTSIAATAQEEMMMVVEDTPNITVDEYNAIHNRANSDPAFGERVTTRIEQVAPQE